MMGTVDKEKFPNWVKSSLSLRYAKDALAEFANEKADCLKDDIEKAVEAKCKSAVNTTCSSCTPKSVHKKKGTVGEYYMNCKSNVCNHWISMIQNHAKPKHHLEWSNSDPTQWPRQSWEIAKVFMAFGCDASRNAHTIDCTNLMTMMIGCTFFHNFISNLTVLQEIKDIRNSVMHSGSLEVSDSDMKVYLNKLVELLYDPVCFKNISSCQDAADKIKQLRDNTLAITLSDEKEELSNLINELQKDVLDLKKMNDVYKQDVQNLSDDLSTFSEAHDGLKTDLQTNMKTIEMKQVQCDKLIETLEQKMIGQTEIKERLQLITNQVESLNKDTTQGLQQLKDKFDTINQMQVKTEQRVDVIESRQDTLESRQNMTEQKLEECSKMRDKQKVAESTFEERQKKIQNHLLEMYQDYCKDVCISPFRPNTTRLLSQMYVKQTIKAVDRRGKKQQSEDTSTLSRQQPGTEEEDTKEFNLQDMFYSDGKLCKNIYVTAEAGLGKSTFCKHLVNVWCSAHLKGDTHDLLDDDERVMQAFPLLFYITLNDFRLEKQQPKFDQYATLIEQQWELEDSVKDFLKDRNCLIIADALDESPQDLPYRGKQNKSTILITSRPWKLESLRTVIEGKTIDKQFQIMGLQYKSYSELSTNIISVLANESSSQHKESKKSASFIEEVTEKGLEAFLEVPVLLIQMLILWYDGHAIGNSQAEIYTNIVHHQIDVNECKESKSNATTTESVRNSPLRCSVTDCCCRNYDELLFKVAKLAYETLKDGVMVFNHNQTNFYGLSKENERLCLEMGLLTQEKLFGKFSEMKKEVRFVHKSHHEYFASIHLSTFDQLSQLPTDVNSVITNLDEALKLDKVLMFVAGMNPKMATELAAFIVKKCSDDSRIQEYRRTIGYSGHEGLVEQVQNLILAAEEESRKYPNMPKPKFRLDDIYVYHYNVSRVLSSLPCLEISHLASITMFRLFNRVQVDAVMSHVQNTAGHQKVDLYNCTIGSRETAVKLVPQSLCALELLDVNLPHEALTTLSHDLKKTKLRGLCLWELTCGSHGRLDNGKCGVTFDLTRQSHLETLRIMDCDMSGWSLPTATLQMKRVHLCSLTIPGAMLARFLRGLPQTGVSVYLLNVTVRPAGDFVSCLEQLRGSREVEQDSVEGRGEGEMFVDEFVFI